MGYTYEYVKDFIRSKGDKLLSTQYINYTELLDIKCGKCKEKYKLSFKQYQK